MGGVAEVSLRSRTRRFSPRSAARLRHLSLRGAALAYYFLFALFPIARPTLEAYTLLRFEANLDRPISDIMTREPLFTVPSNKAALRLIEARLSSSSGPKRRAGKSHSQASIRTAFPCSTSG